MVHDYRQEAKTQKDRKRGEREPKLDLQQSLASNVLTVGVTEATYENFTECIN